MGCFLLFANAYSMQMHIFIHIQHATANIICYKGHTVSNCFLGFVEFKGIALIYMARSIRDKQTLNCNGWMFDILV